jgi:hypothetical protein
MPDQELLGIYLDDHFAGARAGLDLAKRLSAADSHSSTLGDVAREIESDRETLREVMATVGVTPSLLKVAAGWVSEKAGRLKLNDRFFGRSPLSRVLELDALIAGVSGKLQLWRALAQVAERDARLESFDFEALCSRAERQRNRLEDLHRGAVSQALRSRCGARTA